MAGGMPAVLQFFIVCSKGVFQAFVAVGRAVWQNAGTLLHAGARFLTAIKPALVYIGAKVVRWYANSYIKRGEKLVHWALWLIGLASGKGK